MASHGTGAAEREEQVMVSFGVEEEFMFLHPETLRPVDVGPAVLRRFAADPVFAGVTNHEYLASQIEHTSAVYSTLDEASAALLQFRRAVAAEAAEHGAIAASVGMPFQAPLHPTITEDDRYERVIGAYRHIISDHQINGLHVHVEVPDPDAGVRALNHLRLWMPLLQAMSGNSPYWRGIDTGYEGWRNIELRRWAVSGCPPAFVDGADYHRRLQNVVGLGGTFDVGMVSWNVRLSNHVPTLEVRVFDAQLRADDTLLLAAVVRGLVTTALSGATAADVPPELLDDALWQAARDGLLGPVLDPLSGSLADAGTAFRLLLDHIGARLDAEGDRAYVADGLERLLRDGTGARRQRAARAAGGPAALAIMLRESVAAAG
ncbi:MAG: YbdK family carboxylate-amine ligase [Leifsonia sp.]